MMLGWESICVLELGNFNVPEGVHSSKKRSFKALSREVCSETVISIKSESFIKVCICQLIIVNYKIKVFQLVTKKSFDIYHSRRSQLLLKCCQFQAKVKISISLSGDDCYVTFLGRINDLDQFSNKC